MSKPFPYENGSGNMVATWQQRWRWHEVSGCGYRLWLLLWCSAGSEGKMGRRCCPEGGTWGFASQTLEGCMHGYLIDKAFFFVWDLQRTTAFLFLAVSSNTQVAHGFSKILMASLWVAVLHHLKTYTKDLVMILQNSTPPSSSMKSLHPSIGGSISRWVVQLRHILVSKILLGN